MENLPLIPDKGESVCADVRPVLRQVFRGLETLPPLRDREDTCAIDDNQQWLQQQYDTERKEIWKKEGELKEKHAQRLARSPLPNIYKLHSPKATKSFTWKNQHGVIERKDLMPSIEQNACRDNSLWIKNILNTSSSQFTSVQVTGTGLTLPLKLQSYDNFTDQSLSIGEIVPKPPTVTRSAPPAPPQPDHVVCVPPRLEFINFTIGQLHTEKLRVVNVSKFEVRLSVRPPERRELDIEVCGLRGLAVSSGSAAEFKVHFRPRDVRVLHDVLLIRVSTGQVLTLPIVCYMQPPLLNILVPSVPMVTWPTKSPSVNTSDVVELGARLLGDVHSVTMLFHCEATHASFFIVHEDDWNSYSLDALTSRGSLMADNFVLYPVCFEGGGVVRVRAWCRADVPGLHAAALRVISSTAIVRPLQLIADSLYYRPYHLTIEGQEKDYDILSEDDPECEYYVHLGTALPHRALSLTVPLINHSPVSYSFYQRVRRWGICSCWEDFKVQAEQRTESEETISDDDLCPGAREARDREQIGLPEVADPCSLVRVESAGSISARSASALRVHLPDAGAALGTQRAVIMLILKNIPKECLPPDYEPMIVKTDVIDADPIPGVESWSREVCEIVCAQLEVWWEVVPVRFVLSPPTLPLKHSRRVTSIELSVSATQLFGADPVTGHWEVPAGVPLHRPVTMNGTIPCVTTVKYPLPELPNEYPEIDVIRLKTTNNEWQAECSVTRQCSTRHVALRPARVVLGVVPPGACMRATLRVINDTHQHTCWWATPYRWLRENVVSAACEGRAPCDECRERACSCGLVRPARGALPCGDAANVHYCVNAPESDGCVATLIRVQRTSADVAHVHGGAAVTARAAVIAYRVLAPRVLVRVLPCGGVGADRDCEGCRVDLGELKSERGTASLRPYKALTVTHKTCYRLMFTNTTPIPTRVTWDRQLEEDVLKVKFIPNQFDIDGYAEVQIQVVLDARKVTGRSLFVCRATVLHAYKPIYLLIDAEIAGLEIICEIPIGDEKETTSKLIMKRSQLEEFPWDSDAPKPNTFEEMFAHEDYKRAVRRENVCRCHYELVYIPPVKRPKNPMLCDSIEIVTEPPPMTRVCECFKHLKPIIQDHTEPFCLQFKHIPLRTVCTRTVTIRNTSLLTAKWKTAVRRWPRKHVRTMDKDEWASGVCSAGVAVQCAPAAGTAAAGAAQRVHVSVYADCWGHYHEQILIKVECLEAIVVDVWIEAVGSPMHFPINPARDDTTSTLWFSSLDPERVLRARNESRSQLTVHAYILTQHEQLQDSLPFRLYLRFFDVMPRTCPCVTAFEDDSVVGETDRSLESTSTYVDEMDTGIELYLTDDYGYQDNNYYKVSPEVCTVSAGRWSEWRVTLEPPPHRELAPPAALLLRTIPDDNTGDGWCRVEPAPQIVLLRHTERESRLRASCSRIHVALCALDLPYNDILKVRKKFQLKNVGNGELSVCARTQPPWALAARGAARRCGAGCSCSDTALQREQTLHLLLLPRTSLEMCVEVHVNTMQVWPEGGTNPCQVLPYDERKRSVTKLTLYDDDNVLLSVPLVLELEFPALHVEPQMLDFGFVTDGDTRKSYFTVSHSSRMVTLEVAATWIGVDQFTLSPEHLSIRPGHSERVYIQYTARWSRGPVEGCVCVCARSGAGAWCRAGARARAAPARDHGARGHPRDHTDDCTLLPPPYTH